MIYTARVRTDRRVTQRPPPPLLTRALQGFGAGAVETSRRRTTRVTVISLISRLTRALPRGHAHAVVGLAVRVTLRVVAEHPRPARLAVAGEALGAVAMETPG